MQYYGDMKYNYAINFVTPQCQFQYLMRKSSDVFFWYNIISLYLLDMDVKEIYNWFISVSMYITFNSCISTTSVSSTQHVNHRVVASLLIVYFTYVVARLTENSRSFLPGSKTSWATESPVTGSRAMQRVYPRSVQQRASPWRLTTLPARGWGPAIEHCRRATSSPSAQEGRRCAER